MCILKRNKNKASAIGWIMSETGDYEFDAGEWFGWSIGLGVVNLLFAPYLQITIMPMMILFILVKQKFIFNYCLFINKILLINNLNKNIVSIVKNIFNVILIGMIKLSLFLYYIGDVNIHCVYEGRYMNNILLVLSTCIIYYL